MGEMKLIAVYHGAFRSKFGIPRQAGIVAGLTGRIVFESRYRSPDAVRGLEEFDYLWLLWQCSQRDALTVRPPRLGGNRQMGVFATRSPFRPNPIGLSSVRIERIDYDCADAPVIHVSGADLMDGTAIYDIKPYIPYTDAHAEARAGFTDTVNWQPLKVEFSEEALGRLPEHLLSTLKDILEQDPRPHYHEDPGREYGMQYACYDVHFTVSDGTLTVTEVKVAK